MSCCRCLREMSVTAGYAMDIVKEATRGNWSEAEWAAKMFSGSIDVLKDLGCLESAEPMIEDLIKRLSDAIGTRDLDTIMRVSEDALTSTIMRSYHKVCVKY